MTKINEHIENKGLKKSKISEKLNVTRRTLYNMCNYQNIDQIKKFIELTNILELSEKEIIGILKEIKKTSK